MSVYKRGGIWWMRFRYRGQRIERSTGQIDREAAEAVERREKDRLRQQAHGVAITAKPETPRFQDWAEVYFTEASKKVSRPERIEDLVRVALGFWGGKPADPTKVYPDAPYHDLRLSDPVDDTSWLLRWEQWLEAPKRPRPRKDGRGGAPAARTWSGQTKDQYRSLLSQMYALACRPAWSSTTGVSTNPFKAVDRDGSGRRLVALELEDLRAILAAASAHLRVAIAIALLAPKLRLGSILKLRFDQHLSSDLAWLTVRTHKTVTTTERPQVAYVPEQLRTILAAAKAEANRKAPYVVHYRGKPITELRGAIRGAVDRARKTRPNLKYGRGDADGITFHTLRHSAATHLAVLGVSPDLRKDVMGHESIETTLLYTHLRPIHEVAAAERLSAALPIADLILEPPVATSVVTDEQKPRKLAKSPTWKWKSRKARHTA